MDQTETTVEFFTKRFLQKVSKKIFFSNGYFGFLSHFRLKNHLQKESFAKRIIHKKNHSQKESFAKRIIRKKNHSQKESFAKRIIRKKNHWRK